eukprot:14310133-Ditylum_brightwellii.AAC.1
MHQKELVPCDKYLKMFTNQKDVMEHIGGSVASHPGLNRLMLKEAGINNAAGTSTAEKAKAVGDAKEAYMAMAFLASATRARYGMLLKELTNNYLKGTDEYPCTMVAAHKLLLNYQNNPHNHAHVTTSSNEVAFVTEGKTNKECDSGKEEELTLIHEGKIVDRNGKEIECYNCGGNHYASKCPEQSEWEQDNKGRRQHKERPKKKEKDAVAFNWGNVKWDNDGPPGGL